MRSGLGEQVRFLIVLGRRKVNSDFKGFYQKCTLRPGVIPVFFACAAVV